MRDNSSAILALILLVVLVIIVVVSLSYNPAPAIVVEPVAKTPREILEELNKSKVQVRSGMSPEGRSQLSPHSEESPVSTAWDALNRMRSQRKTSSPVQEEAF